MQPIAHTQQASSRATATLATQGRLPASRSARCLAASLAVHFAHRLSMSAGTASEPDLGGLGEGEQLAKCQAASTRARLVAELPVLVMPPRATFSPLECSEGTRPTQAA